MAKSDTKRYSSKSSKRKRNRSVKKINETYQESVKRFLEANGKGRVKLMFFDEAGFGRITKPKACWITGKVRSSVPSHHIREYRYAYGAVDPLDGQHCFIAAPRCNSDWANAFFEELSKAYPDDYILLVMDHASWHKSKTLHIPKNMECIYLPPYTLEMNPIEQIWTELRKSFANKSFKTLTHVMDQLHNAVKILTHQTVKSMTGRKWILDLYQL